MVSPVLTTSYLYIGVIMGKKIEEINYYKSYGIPETLKVGAVTYKIIFPYTFNEDSSYIGLHEFDTLTIKLGIMSPSHQSAMLPKQRIQESLIHEMIHAIETIFCDSLFTEEEVERLSMAWHSILTENDLHIRNNNKCMPKKVKIFSFYYDIKFVEFNDIEDQSICSSNACTIHMADSVRLMSTQLQKMLLIYMLNCLIDRAFDMRFVDERKEGLNKVFKCFSSGFYQVLYENDLERVLRCKKCGMR